MTHEALFERIRDILTSKFGEEVVEQEEPGALQPSLTIKTEAIADVCLELRDNPDTYFDFLSCLSGVDHGTEAENRFEAVYHLASIPYKMQFTLKAKAKTASGPDGLPEVPSVSTVWKTAEWHERETYDLLGIWFAGHPDMRRILLPDDWEGYPLRKDYKTAEYYKGIKIDY